MKKFNAGTARREGAKIYLDFKTLCRKLNSDSIERPAQNILCAFAPSRLCVKLNL